MDTIEVGMKFDGYCNGHFGGLDTWGEKTIVAIGSNFSWIVVKCKKNGKFYFEDFSDCLQDVKHELFAAWLKGKNYPVYCDEDNE